NLTAKTPADPGIYNKSSENLPHYKQDCEIYITGYAGINFSKNSNKNPGIEIPAYIDDCPVVSLAGLQEVPFTGELRIPETVRKICDMCFEFQNQITKVIIPDSVKSIGEHVFCFCDDIEEIIFPDSLEKLSLGIASECYQLRRVHLPENLKEIPECFMSGCPSLEEIVIPEHVVKILDCAFDDCEHLKHVKLPQNLKYIGKFAFSSCPELEKPAIPDGCEVHKEAFD
ncbi:MAG: leucine-rich repeat domain-containing protein, partial [Oscillospiraceae bacterium]|nr:leucine-rich repeat domain-containing protein [Oscillospiraceae bacterium]